MICPNCSAENRPGQRFCVKCGTPLARVCPSCGTPAEPDDAFCGTCGTPLAGGAPAAAPRPEPSAAAAPSSERRLVSVLFADLVDFTALSERRDAEEVRELLSRYFETCQRLISLYGGTVEKFIGDAVMAVWGTPTAQEDDAERAVRTALDIVPAVTALGDELGVAELRARAGVLTGEAAVSLGADGQGMVAGDLVNTASRIQAAAAAGTVLVGEVTKRATEAAIAFEDAGSHELKGKAGPLPLWRALRVTAARGGALKSDALEPPFVGRERELRLVKELLHASAEEGRAHLISIIGLAGIGKSRLAWELYKYVDGLADTIWWHRGRCLAYGEGVTYWALAEMVRMRAGIAEGEDPASARKRLHEAALLHVTDDGERAWIEPRLAHLLGLEDLASAEREDLFGAWRLFFERMAEVNPLIMVFEDMQWADTSLLEFVDYLLEWSGSHPIYVLTLARPELSERRPTWAAAGRVATTVSLEPLRPQAMDALLAGFVPGLSDELRGRILERSGGVPLYAVETVRMLLDRGLVVREGEVYRPTGPIGALDVPETLHALVAARLDGLEPDERRLVQRAAVLGKTFTKAALGGLAGLAETELDALLGALVRKQVLSLQADPRSPERGQFGFLQDLVLRVAYETLPKSERKQLHLSAAAQIEAAWGSAEHEVAEVLASHYISAFEAAPEADDASEIRAKARDALEHAAERAASLAANDEAYRYFVRVADLADDPLAEAAARERAGAAVWLTGAASPAREQLDQALELFEAAGETHQAARVLARIGDLDFTVGRLNEGRARMEQAYAVLRSEEPDADVAALAAQLGRALTFAGELGPGSELIEAALATAERLRLTDVIAEALTTAAIIALLRGRHEQAFALVSHALALALEHDHPTAALRAYNNLAETLVVRDRHRETIDLYRSGIALARKVGDRRWERILLGELAVGLERTGQWREALEAINQVPEDTMVENYAYAGAEAHVKIALAQGEPAVPRRLLELFAELEDSPDLQVRAFFHGLKGLILKHEGRLDEAREAFLTSVDVGGIETGSESAKLAVVESIECAIALSDWHQAEELLGRIAALRRGELPPFLRANHARLGARLAAARGEEDGVEPGFTTAAGVFRKFDLPFHVAVTQLEHGEWLVTQRRADEAEPLLAEAAETFARLEATPWLERASSALVPTTALESLSK